MQREGANPEHMVMADFSCDFCGHEWTMTRHMVEGHQGTCICSNCLTIAFTEMVFHKVSDEPNPDEACELCRETGRADAHWRSPVDETKFACKRCVKQSAGVLHKDPDLEWKKPIAPEGVETSEPDE